MNRSSVGWSVAEHKLTKDRNVLRTFYDFPVEHWKHTVLTNPSGENIIAAQKFVIEEAKPPDDDMTTRRRNTLPSGGSLYERSD